MLPTITDLRDGAPANDISEKWMDASEDADKISKFYKKLANDQFDAYEKTMDRIMQRHNGHGARYRHPETGRFISRSSAVANDKIDRYQATLDRIMNTHNDHDNAPGPGDAENDNRIIHDYNPEIPQGVHSLMKKFVEKNQKPIEKDERPEAQYFNADDSRTDTDLLKSINNDTTNILDALHHISHTIDDYTDEASLRAKEKARMAGNETSQDNHEGSLAWPDGAKNRANNPQPTSKPGFFDNLESIGKDAMAGLGLMAGGLATTFASKIVGTPAEPGAGGGYKHHAEVTSMPDIATGKPVVTGSRRKQELQLMAYDAFKKRGWTDKAAEMGVAEIGRENAFNEDTSGHRGDVFGYHIDPGNHELNLGIISWQKDRRVKLERFLKSKGLMNNGKMVRNQASMDAMVEFMDEEMRTGSGGLGNKGKQAYRDVRDSSKNNSELESALGRGVIKWNPKVDHNGYNRLEQHLSSIEKLLSDRNSKAKVDAIHQPMKDVKSVVNSKNENIAKNSAPPQQTNITVNNNQQTHNHSSSSNQTHAPEKKRPQPAKSDSWEDWKSYFGWIDSGI